MRSVWWLAVVGGCAGTVGAQSPVAQLAATPSSLKASGYQPDWTLDISADKLTLSTNLQLQEPPPRVIATTNAPVRVPSASGDVLRYATSSAKGELQAQFAPAPCTDAIQGTLHPYTVEVRYAGMRYSGCGGDPAALLQNRLWVVEDIAARGVMDRTRLTLQFSSGGEVSGRASCYLLDGNYQTTGNNLRLNAAPKVTAPKPIATPPATPPPAPTPEGVAPTSKICPPALRRQDAAFFEVLNAASRWDFTADGALALGTLDGRRIVARRE